MLTEKPNIGLILRDVYGNGAPRCNYLMLPENPLDNDAPGVRPNSASVEDCSFGDSGKGRIIQEINYLLWIRSGKNRIYSERFNGTRNAGHEVVFDGVRVALHQLPVAVLQEGAVAIIGKGMLVHPNDLVTEITYVENKIGSQLPGELVIDQNAVVTTDLHSALETYTNKKLDVGKGATGSGVAQGYAGWYEKRAITVADFAASDWREKFIIQYNFYAEMMGGVEVLANTEVNHLTVEGTRQNPKPKVGNLPEFLDRLEDARTKLIGRIRDTRDEVENVWSNHPKIPFSFEGAQGGGLDPYFGVYSDVTASRPVARVGIPDSTEGAVIYEEIAMRLSTIKIPYMSSVGSRIPPYEMDPEIARMYRTENEETGRSTGRDRGIYPIDLVLMAAIRHAAGYNYLAITHLDSSHPEIPIEVVTDYVDKETGQIQRYRPYQWHWDRVEGTVRQLPSWDGKKAAGAESVEELPEECLRFMSFIGRVLAPAVLGTDGRSLGQTIYFMQK